MPKVVLQPASGPAPTRHYARTIARPVPLAEIAGHVSPSFLAELQRAHPNGAALVWGAVPENRAAWDAMAPGDHVLFYKEGRFISSAVVTAKIQSASLARHLWEPNEEGDLFEYTFFLENLRTHDIPYADIWRLTRFGRQDLLPRLTVLPLHLSPAVLDHYGEQILSRRLEPQHDDVRDRDQECFSSNRLNGQVSGGEMTDTDAYHTAQRAMADLKAAVLRLLASAPPAGLTNAEIGRTLGIYAGHVGHQGHIPRTLLALMENEGVTEQDPNTKRWRVKSQHDPSPE